MSTQGSVFKQKGCANWILAYYVNGTQRHESSHTTSKRRAEAILLERLTQLGKSSVDPIAAKRTAYEDLKALLLADYKARELRTLRVHKNGQSYLSNTPFLDEHFKNWKASSITAKAVDSFVAAYRATGVTNSTVNRSLAMLRRMFNLASQRKLVFEIPHISFLPENKPRQGFVEDGQFNKILAFLPEHLKPSVTFLYLTGCRVGAARLITGAMLHREKGQLSIELPGTITKNGRPLWLPLTNGLAEHFRNRIVSATEPLFSFRNLRKEWEKACKAAGEAGLMIHDLRRSGVRNLSRAGISDTVVMQISGHRTRDVFMRYNIVSNEDVAQAMEKLERVSQVR